MKFIGGYLFAIVKFKPSFSQIGTAVGQGQGQGQGQVGRTFSSLAFAPAYHHASASACTSACTSTSASSLPKRTRNYSSSSKKVHVEGKGVRTFPFSTSRNMSSSSTSTSANTNASASASANTSSSMSSSRYAYDELTQSLIEKHKYPHPLVDVDCNLIHEDLTSMLADSKIQAYQRATIHMDTDKGTDIDADANNNDGENEYRNRNNNNGAHFRILHHPSTVASNIQAVFSPASTLDEAEAFHAQLIASTAMNRNYIDVRMSVGVHPYHADEAECEAEAGDLNVEDIESSRAYDRIKALMDVDSGGDNGNGYGYITCIGETGLDYSDGFPAREKQLPWFEFQLKLAKEYNLPLFIHERLAFDDTIRLIDEVFPRGDAAQGQGQSPCPCPCPPIIIHCFTGSKEECQAYIERGYHISVSGYILKNGDGPEEVRTCLRDGIIPLDKLMIETDAPYMGYPMARESYYKMEEMMENDEFTSLKSKKRKSLLKGMYPNVPSALPKVLEETIRLLNEGRRARAQAHAHARGEEEISMEEGAAAIFANSVQFFGMKTNTNTNTILGG